MVILSFENVAAGYGSKQVLKGINFHINRGESVGIVGPNGSGKTTLLRVIARALPPSQGRVLLFERNLNAIPRTEFSKIVSFLPSAMEINYPYTVREFVEMARYPFTGFMQRTDERGRTIINNVIQNFNISDLLQKTISELSEGEKQRVYLAQCLAQEPQLLLLDEPTSHLDIGHQFYFLDMLKRNQVAEGMTVLSIFHDLNLAAQYCDRVVMLNNGRIAAIGTPTEVLTYEIIEAVYRTAVLVYPHPISGKPYVFGIPSQWRDRPQNPPLDKH
jgi:iron complex transport system ATP-binding protein